MKKHFYAIMVLAGLVLWVSETAYFGFNKHAASPAESMLDTISWFLIVWGSIGNVLSGIEIHKNYQSEKHYENNYDVKGQNIKFHIPKDKTIINKNV